MGIILTYSIEDPQSFRNIDNWMKEVKEHASENACMILIGNKCDITDRAVSYEDGKNLAEKYDIPFYETSAKNGININEAFMTILRDIKNKTLEEKTSYKSQTDEAYDWLVKLLIIGDSRVGKTNILLRFCDMDFIPSHLTTIGIDFKLKILEVEGKKLKMQIWDTSGQEMFKTITQTYYKGATGIILTYSIAEPETFRNIENWMKEIQQQASENVCKILVGNKCDIPDRAVSYEEGKSLADKYDIPFYETSAKSGININEMFMAFARDIKHKILEEKTSFGLNDIKTIINFIQEKIPKLD